MLLPGGVVALLRRGTIRLILEKVSRKGSGASELKDRLFAQRTTGLTLCG